MKNEMKCKPNRAYMVKNCGKGKKPDCRVKTYLLHVQSGLVAICLFWHIC